jgi:uncharacterized protein (DUF1697 family)
MPRFAALLRGVSPSNAKMPELRAAFESAGFTEVKTVLSSGNVLFTARSSSEDAVRRAAESAMEKRLGTAFLAIVRPLEMLRTLVATDPYRGHDVAPTAKRFVTFLRAEPAAAIALPVERDGARLLALVGRELFGAYLPSPKGPAFMTLIERTFGKEVTTRTWDTVAKIARG